MQHAGVTKSFSAMLKETSLAFSFGLAGILAGFIVASQSGIQSAYGAAVDLFQSAGALIIHSDSKTPLIIPSFIVTKTLYETNCNLRSIERTNKALFEEFPSE